MVTYTVEYEYLEPKKITVYAEDAKNAAERFFALNGKTASNYGRCVIVRDIKQMVWRFACIKLQGDVAAIFRLKEDGIPYDGQPYLDVYFELYPLQ